jgi:hypothetical protein
MAPLPRCCSALSRVAQAARLLFSALRATRFEARRRLFVKRWHPPAVSAPSDFLEGANVRQREPLTGEFPMTDAEKNAPRDDEVTPEECKRDPEDREVHRANIRKLREKMMDKTLADSYPASDPPSSIPDPGEDDSMKQEKDKAA